VCARRLDRHGLALPVPVAGLAEQVGVMCGAHAQVLAAAELSVALRVDGATRADVRSALWDARTLVKTFGPRGTIHLLPAAELATWMAALGSLPVRRPPPPVGLTERQTDEVVDAVADALADAELTLDELTDAVVERTGPWAGEPVMEAFQGRWPRWRQVMHVAARRGALSFGPNRGRRVTYTSPHRWVPGFRLPDADAAVDAVVRRFLHAYGPATPRQLAQWLAAPPTLTVAWFERLGDELEPVDVEGSTAWVLAGDTRAPEPSSEVRLLPYFDAYGIGSHPRTMVFPGAAADRALIGGQAGNLPLLVVGGVVAGVWHHKRSGRRLTVTVEPIGRLTAARRRAVDDQVARVGEVLEAEPTWSVGDVPVGGHL
jgi:hypothetical protein